MDILLQFGKGDLGLRGSFTKQGSDFLNDTHLLVNHFVSHLYGLPADFLFLLTRIFLLRNITHNAQEHTPFFRRHDGLFYGAVIFGKVGALIVIERAMPLDEIAVTGDQIDSNINQRLIENIFFKNSPLHDGAMIVSKKRIKAAGCILPVSHDMDIPKELGLRHRAAMGVSQESDAVAIVVSEETGGISVAVKGEFHLRLSAEELESILTKELEQ